MRLALPFIMVLKISRLIYQDQDQHQDFLKDQDLKLKTKTLYLKTKTTFLVLEVSRDHTQSLNTTSLIIITLDLFIVCNIT